MFLTPPRPDTFAASTLGVRSPNVLSWKYSTSFPDTLFVDQIDCCMKYAYENLSPTQFENLVVFICSNLFGISVQGFSTGPDGGRDARFNGEAELYPSRAKPWSGTTIIQAKHTNAHNRHFGESDFYTSTATSGVLHEEVPRVRKLVNDGELDHYIIFANRRLSAGSESKMRNFVSEKCCLPASSVAFCGIEQLEIWLKMFPDAAEMVDLDPIDSPLIVSPDDLAEVVETLAGQWATVPEVIDDPPTPRIHHEEKNAINKMSPSYAREQRTKYLNDTETIRIFLAAPENYSILRRYESVVDEFQSKIISKRKDYQSFDEVMEYLIDLLFGRDPILKQVKHKRLTRAILFYMYWNCDIGEMEGA